MAIIKGYRAAGVYAGVSYETIRNWHKQYGIGWRVGNTFFVEAEELAPFVEAYKLRSLADQKIEPLRGRDPKRL